jgi:hypothetical protein
MIALIGTAACESPPPPRVAVRFHVVNESGEPVHGARVTAQGRSGKSDREGTLTWTLEGRAGTEVGVSLECPVGFLTEDRAAGLRLLHTRAAIGPGEPAPLLWTGLCRRAARAVALVVHTDALSGLPVIVDGAARTQTNADGNAHILLTIASNAASVHVSLDTSSDPLVKPQNPARVFTVSDADGLLVFDPGVARARPAPKPARRRVERAIPYRVR